jgi:hypothetical protein
MPRHGKAGAAAGAILFGARRDGLALEPRSNPEVHWVADIQLEDGRARRLGCGLVVCLLSCRNYLPTAVGVPLQALLEMRARSCESRLAIDAMPRP